MRTKYADMTRWAHEERGYNTFWWYLDTPEDIGKARSMCKRVQHSLGIPCSIMLVQGRKYITTGYRPNCRES